MSQNLKGTVSNPKTRHHSGSSAVSNNNTISSPYLTPSTPIGHIPHNLNATDHLFSSISTISFPSLSTPASSHSSSTGSSPSHLPTSSLSPTSSSSPPPCHQLTHPPASSTTWPWVDSDYTTGADSPTKAPVTSDHRPLPAPDEDIDHETQYKKLMRCAEQPIFHPLCTPDRYAPPMFPLNRRNFTKESCTSDQHSDVSSPSDWLAFMGTLKAELSEDPSNIQSTNYMRPIEEKQTKAKKRQRYKKSAPIYSSHSPIYIVNAPPA